MLGQKSTVRLTLGYKLLMAATGLILVGFLLAHLCGNLLLFAGAEAINQYALKLREYPLLLWLARGVLLLSVCGHIYAGIKLSLLNKKARPQAYAKAKRVKAGFASQSMLLSGLIVLFFIVYHLAHFTFKWTHRAMFQFLDEHDVYSMVLLSFKSPWVTGFYVLSVILLMVHLYHGIRSIFQTLGLNHPKYNLAIKIFGQSLSVLLAFGFLTLPLSVFFKFLE